MVRWADGSLWQAESAAHVEHRQYLPLDVDRSEHDVRCQR
jgi:hypothetical protein